MRLVTLKYPITDFDDLRTTTVKNFISVIRQIVNNQIRHVEDIVEDSSLNIKDVYIKNEFVYVDVNFLVNNNTDKNDVLLFLKTPVYFSIQYNERSISKPKVHFNTESSRSTYPEIVLIKKIKTYQFSTDEEDPDSPNYVDEPGPLEAGKKRLRKNKCSRF